MSALTPRRTPGRQAAAIAGARVVEFDALRGLAILLMIVDHTLIVYGDPFGLRDTLTRASMPLFMVLAGVFWKPGWRWRYLEVFGAAVVASICLAALDGATVDILGVFLLVLPALYLAQRWRLLVLALAILQPTTWPIPWHAYQPGTVLAFLIVGQLVTRTASGAGWSLAAVGERVRWLAALGRWSLTLYVGHLVVLVALSR